MEEVQQNLDGSNFDDVDNIGIIGDDVDKQHRDEKDEYRFF